MAAKMAIMFGCVTDLQQRYHAQNEYASSSREDQRLSFESF